MAGTANRTSKKERVERKTGGSPGSWLKIGEVSELTGVGIETLRFYERSGVLDPPRRTETGYRLYNAEALDRLAFIKRAQMLGFSLVEIARLIAEKRAGQSPCAEVREIVRRRLQELDERMREIRRYRRELADALQEWDEAGEADGHVCGLIEGTVLASQHPEARPLKRRTK